MPIFTCSCLNIRIHGKGDTPKLQDVSYPHFKEDTTADSFFIPNTYVVTLGLGGVTKSQKSLCKDRFVDGWTIMTCTCCALEIYAQHCEDHDRVIVSHNAEQNSEAISQLMESQRYSHLFKLMLPEINDNFIQNNIGIELKNSNLDSSIVQVQNQVSNYLRDEQTAMEERIRKFTESQQSDYADLLQKIRKQKQSMVYLLLKSKENGACNQNEVARDTPVAAPAAVAAMNKDTGGSNESSTSTDSVFDKSESLGCSHDKTRKPNVRSFHRSLSNPVRSTKPKNGPRRMTVNIDVGGVFEMEEFDSKEEFSDFDSEDSESSYIEDSGLEKSKDQTTFASSLPMSIPNFTRNSQPPVIEDEEDDFGIPLPKDPEQIAASMRALACSVRDGTEMFGELPRRRLNTGDLLSSRLS